jgi:hypothetical protein
VVTAQVCSKPVAIVANETPLGMLTATGTLLSVCVPLPSWPKLLLPQQYATPPVAIAQLLNLASTFVKLPHAKVGGIAVLVGVREAVDV